MEGRPEGEGTGGLGRGLGGVERGFFCGGLLATEPDGRRYSLQGRVWRLRRMRGWGDAEFFYTADGGITFSGIW